MTNMRHKSPDARRQRRNRYKNAIEPFRQKYNCTAAEVFGVISGIESQVIKNKIQLEEFQNKIMELQNKIEEMERTVISELEKQLKDMTDRAKLAEDTIADFKKTVQS